MNTLLNKTLRATLCALGLAAATLVPARAATGTADAAAPATLVDIVGRTVAIPAKVEHILLGEGRFLYALAMLDGEAPLARIAGWQGELPFADPNGYAEYRRRYPQIDRIPVIGRTSEDSVSAERSVATRPDIAIFGLGGHGPGRQSALVRQMEQAGVPVVFIDFRSEPVAHTLQSMRILGRAVHREAQAEAYAAFYESRLRRVRERVQGVPASQRPRVFVELLAGVWDGCCHTVGKGNMGEFVTAAGGINVAEGKVPGAIGDMNLEALLALDPEVYIATGSRAQGNRLMLKAGAGVTPPDLASSLRALAARTGIESLGAVRQGRAHGLWHNFYDAPTNIVAIEAMAKWFYPERFRDVDPQLTLDEINRRFLAALPMQGTFWGDLSGGTKP